MDFDKTKGYPGEGPGGSSALLPFESFMTFFILYRQFYLEISSSLEAFFMSLVRLAEAKEAF
jgi:hypothetical protein